MKRMQADELLANPGAALEAAERGEPTIILRDGQPIAMIRPIEERAGRPDLPQPRERGGLLSLIGLFDDWATMDEDVAGIMAERRRDFGRPLPELD